MAPRAGWYPDPRGEGEYRYWDGDAWTNRIASREDDPPLESGRLSEGEVATVTTATQVVSPMGSTTGQRGNGLAVAALVLGIVGVLTGIIPLLFFVAWALGVLAVALGWIGRRAARRDRGGKGIATAGVVLGVAAFALGVLGVVIVNDAFDDLDDDLSGDVARAPTTDEGASNTDEPVDADSPAGDSDDPEGTRESPFALGTPLRSESGWEVTVNSVDFDPAAAIAAENQFNDPAEPGKRYVIVNVTITNDTDESGTPWLEVDIAMVGSENRLWDSLNASCSAVIPDDLFVTGETLPGGSVSGNTCLQTPEGEVADGSLLVAVTASLFGDDPVFVRTS